MSHKPLSHTLWLSRLNDHLKNESYAGCTAKHCVAIGRAFLAFLEKQHMTLHSVQPTHVQKFLQQALRRFQRRHGHLPAYRQWRSIYTAPVHMLLRLVYGQWPPTPKPVTRVERLQHQLCQRYVCWLLEVRGLAAETVFSRRREAHRFLAWLHTNRLGLAVLRVTHLDRYLKERAHGLRRSTINTVTGSLRSFLHWLHSIGQASRDFSTVVVRPSMYAFASIPSTLRSQDMEKVLAIARQEVTAKGIRDYAILMLLSKYGMRAGEIVGLRLEDIDWRKEVIRVHHSKTGVTSYLPLLPEVGNALLGYLQKARPETSFRQVFIRNFAPYRPFPRGGSIYNIVRRRLDAAGVITSGKRGPHVFRHARAVSLLRARVPLKEIGDVLGHRSTLSTMAYLKLAMEDLRAVALDIPLEVQA